MEPEKVRDLVLAAASGDEPAWQLLVQNFSGLVWSVARSQGLGQADAADVLQTTWLRLAEHLGRIDSPERVGSWLATTARREAQRLRRLSGRVVSTDSEIVLGRETPPEQWPEQVILEAERVSSDARRDQKLWSALGQLPGRCQQLLRVLIASPPPSYADIAEALEMPVGSIGPTRARCLGRLRAILAREGISGSVTDS